MESSHQRAIINHERNVAFHIEQIEGHSKGSLYYGSADPT